MNLKNRKLFEFILGCVFLLYPTFYSFMKIFAMIKIWIFGSHVTDGESGIGWAIVTGACMITGAILIINSYKK